MPRYVIIHLQLCKDVDEGLPRPLENSQRILKSTGPTSKITIPEKSYGINQTQMN